MKRLLLTGLLSAAPLACGPALAAEPSYLTAGDLSHIDEALRWAGLIRADLDFPKDYVNYGLPEAADRWRLPAAKKALENTLWLPATALQWTTSLSSDLPPTPALPKWSAARELIEEQWEGEASKTACQAPQAEEQDGLLDQSARAAEAAGERWNRRTLTDLRARIDPRIDQQVGALLDAQAWSQCRLGEALNGISQEDRQSLRTLFAETLTGASLGRSEDKEEAAFHRLTAAWDSVNRGALLEAGAAWTQALLDAASVLAALPDTAWPQEPLILPSANGPVWLGSPANNSGTGDPILLVDPGGDDQWRIAPERQDLSTADPPAVRGWIDLGGADLWTGGELGPGGALFSIGSGVDLDGDDVYRAGRLSLGGAAFGFASWLDLGGSDRYDGTVGTQGFAAYGAAVLRDGGDGADLYRADHLGQAAAWTGGVAILHDQGGNDRYLLGGRYEDHPDRLPGRFSSAGQAFAIGQRPWAGGGLALLLDEAGHDEYSGGLWVQGSSYWHSLALLVDRSGNDRYTATQYSQGSGIHLSSAGLFDLEGDDSYSLDDLGQGSGHDLAVSWLLDGAGSDTYRAKTSALGTSLTNSTSIFLDRSGDDRYSADAARSFGQAFSARGFGSIALFLDRGGDDRYPADGKPIAPKGTWVRRTGHGVTLDAGPPPSEGGAGGGEPDGSGTPAAESLPPPSTEQAAQALLLDNTQWVVPMAQTDQAVDAIFRAGENGLTWVLPLSSDPKILRSYTIDRLITRWIEAAKAGADTHEERQDGDATQLESVARTIADSALAWDPDAADAAPRWHARWLTRLLRVEPRAAAACVEVAEALRRHPAWRVRKSAWTLVESVANTTELQLAEADRSEWTSRAAGALQNDPLPEVQAAAARALGALHGEGVAAALATALRAPSFELRDSAELALEALVDSGQKLAVARALFPIASGETEAPPPSRDAALRLLGATQHRDAPSVLKQGLESSDPATQWAAAQGAKAHGSAAALRELESLASREGLDPSLQALLSELDSVVSE